MDVENQGHIACVLGIDDLGGGRYAVHVAHDRYQGDEGGLVSGTRRTEDSPPYLCGGAGRGKPPVITGELVGEFTPGRM